MVDLAGRFGMEPPAAYNQTKSPRPKVHVHWDESFNLCAKTPVVPPRLSSFFSNPWRALSHDIVAESRKADHSFAVQLLRGNHPPVLLVSHTGVTRRESSPQETFFGQPLTTRFQGGENLPNLHQSSDRSRLPFLVLSSLNAGQTYSFVFHFMSSGFWSLLTMCLV